LVISQLSLVISHLSLVISQLSLVISHLSLVISQLSLVISHLSLVISQLPYGSPRTVPCPRSVPHWQPTTDQ